MLTLEDRERLAYTTTPPRHPPIIAATQGCEDARAQRAQYTA